MVGRSVRRGERGGAARVSAAGFGFGHCQPSLLECKLLPPFQLKHVNKMLLEFDAIVQLTYDVYSKSHARRTTLLHNILMFRLFSRKQQHDRKTISL